MATPFPQTPRASRPVIKALHDEAHSPDMKGVAGRLSEPQNADEVFATGRRFIGRISAAPPRRERHAA